MHGITLTFQTIGLIFALVTFYFVRKRFGNKEKNIQDEPNGKVEPPKETETALLGQETSKQNV